MKLKYILIFILTFLFMVPDVNAEEGYCDLNDYARIKNIVNKITITSEYAKDENGNDTGKFNLVIKDLTDELFIIDEITPKEYYFEDTENGTIIIKNVIDVTYKFTIYYKTCDDKLIKTITHKVPKYNYYANNPLCEGIKEEELNVCNRLYQGDLDDETFKKIVNNYKESIDINNQEINEEKNNISNNANKVPNLLEKYYIYIIIGVIVIVILVSATLINRKRGALE